MKGSGFLESISTLANQFQPFKSKNIMKRGRDRPKAESSSMGKGKIWEEPPPDAGMDELLAVLGYKVKTSDMTDVADKLERLEMAMGTTMGDGISQFASSTVHYNPSDLTGWIQNMLSEINAPSPADVLSQRNVSESPLLFHQ